eukprot:6598463-Pyramimonas_sp.AAC.1
MPAALARNPEWMGDSPHGRSRHIIVAVVPVSRKLPAGVQNLQLRKYWHPCFTVCLRGPLLQATLLGIVSG